MRAAIWLIALFAAAAAVALFAGHNPGTVTLYWPPYRVDMSLNLVLLLLGGFIALVLLAIQALSGIVNLTRQAKQWRLLQRERAMHAALLDGMAHLVAGRFLRARKLAESALSQERSLAESQVELPHAERVRTLSHLLVAESAQALQDKTLRDQHLQLANTAAQGASMAAEAREGVQLRAARWALEDRQPNLALQRLAELPQGASRRTAALRLRLRAARQGGEIGLALETARLLVKHHAFNPDGARVLLRGLACEYIDTAHDSAQLQRVWASLSANERQMPELAIHAAQQQLRNGGDAALAQSWLLPVWERFEKSPAAFARELGSVWFGRFIHAVEAALPDDDTEWLARAERLLRSQPQPMPELQYLVGVACRRRQLWGKARQMLELTAPHLADTALRRRTWRHLAELAQQRGDESARLHAWQQAALLD